MRLKDAIDAIPWRCIGLKQLEMMIVDKDIATPVLPFRVMLVRTTLGASQHKAAMKSELPRLKQFYQQFGSLVELTHIDLRTILPDETTSFVIDDPKVHQRLWVSSHAEFGRYRKWYHERRGRVLAFVG